jgi:hypothetical protein
VLQRPELHVVPPAHAAPQPPQLLPSIRSLTHAPLHGLKPPLQVYPHAPIEQEPVALATPVVHAEAELHVPFDWHVSSPLPEQSVCPGAQTPVHAPLTHVWLEQADAALQVPLA